MQAPDTHKVNAEQREEVIMFKIDQKVSWVCEGQTIIGCIFDIEVVKLRTVYLLLEDGKHPRNGVSVREAEFIKAV